MSDRGEVEEGAFPLTHPVCVCVQVIIDSGRLLYFSARLCLLISCLSLSGDLTHNKYFKLLICMWGCEQVALQTTCNHSPRAFPCLFPFPHPGLIRYCKSGSSYDDVKVELKGVHSHFEDVQLEPNPAYGEVTPSQAQTEPQPYEEFVAIGGVTSDGVAMEENPAYQPAEPPQYEYVAGVTSSDVQMEENPAYQSVDTAAS